MVSRIQNALADALEELNKWSFVLRDETVSLHNARNLPETPSSS
jgi:hypothetical protein